MNMKLPPLFQETDISTLGHPVLPRGGVRKTFTPGRSRGVAPWLSPLSFQMQKIVSKHSLIDIALSL